jgi:hypothetical protein
VSALPAAPPPRLSTRVPACLPVCLPPCSCRMFQDQKKYELAERYFLQGGFATQAVRMYLELGLEDKARTIASTFMSDAEIKGYRLRCAVPSRPPWSPRCHRHAGCTWARLPSSRARASTPTPSGEGGRWAAAGPRRRRRRLRSARAQPVPRRGRYSARSRHLPQDAPVRQGARHLFPRSPPSQTHVVARARRQVIDIVTRHSPQDLPRVQAEVAAQLQQEGNLKGAEQFFVKSVRACGLRPATCPCSFPARADTTRMRARPLACCRTGRRPCVCTATPTIWTTRCALPSSTVGHRATSRRGGSRVAPARRTRG